MKKLIFLLLAMVLMVCGVFATADSEQPPGVFDPETVLAEYNAHEGVFALPTVLVTVTPITVKMSSFQTVMANNNFIAVLPQSLVFGHSLTMPDYYLLC
jgi:hypothetical protein